MHFRFIDNKAFIESLFTSSSYDDFSASVFSACGSPSYVFSVFYRSA